MRGQAGGATEKRKYKAFGRNRSNASLPTDHQFTGQKQDATQLLYYGAPIYGARYYDKYLETFLSPDPLLPDAGNLFAYNRYMYALGNPVKGGLSFVSSCLGGEQRSV